MELALVLLALTATVCFLCVRGEHRARSSWVLCGACGLALVAGAGARDAEADPTLPSLGRALPALRGEGGYVGSAACRSCHPGESASWHASYHRTMTRPATPSAVLGDFDDVALADRGHRTRLFREGDAYWAEMTDPGWFSTAPERRRGRPERSVFRVVMTTGSHHLQSYWVQRSKSDLRARDPEDGVLLQLPWVWLIEDGRWVPTQDSFLAPESDAPQQLAPWLTSCNKCHSVGTRPFLGTREDASESAELGVACEACHGPGADHVEANLSPVRRYLGHFAADDPTVVQPAKLAQARSAEVCGQCHSFHQETDPQRWAQTGLAYRPGDVLADSITVLRHGANATGPRLSAESARGMFWGDGTIRVAGREYNGLVESACFTEGGMSCLSCHSMHGYEEPSDQLDPARAGDAACVACHAAIGADVAAHTFHAVDSPGSRCLDCHMPHTTFGLFVAMRSHRVDSPDAASAARTGRPSACNLCHLDRSLGWTADRLAEWYGHARPRLTPDDEDLALAVRHVVAGDGAQRAIAAWAMGWEPARRASGDRWQGALLARLLDDPYAVTRHVAARSLRAQPGFADFAYDYVAPRAELGRKRREAVRRWEQVARTIAPPEVAPAEGADPRRVLLRPDGTFDEAAHARLLERRDPTPVVLVE